MARPNFVEKTFAGDSKTAKFVKVFSLESFPLYGTYKAIVHRKEAKLVILITLKAHLTVLVDLNLVVYTGLPYVYYYM